MRKRAKITKITIRDPESGEVQVYPLLPLSWKSTHPRMSFDDFTERLCYQAGEPLRGGRIRATQVTMSPALPQILRDAARDEE